MEHIVPKLVIRNKFWTFVPIIFLLMEYFVSKKVIRTFLFRGPICVWNIMFPSRSVIIKVRTVLFRFIYPLTMYYEKIEKGAYRPAWSSLGCMSLSLILHNSNERGKVRACFGMFKRAQIFFLCFG